MLDTLDLSHIHDDPTRQAIRGLLNLVEDLKQENRALREDNQRLRDALNQLKGEQGTPVVKGNTPKPPPPITPRNGNAPRRNGAASAAPARRFRLTVSRRSPSTLRACRPMPSSRATTR